MSRYFINPQDPGVFISSGDIYDRDLDHSSENGLTQFDDNPYLPLRWFVRVGGGYQGYKTKREATKYLKSE